MIQAATGFTAWIWVCTLTSAIRRMNLRGQVAGGMPKGFGALKHKMSIDEYVQALVSGQIFDPTVSIQLRQGFQLHGVIYDYLDDPSCDNKGILIIWHNPDYRAQNQGL
jgi:hypothetical protein